MPEWLIWTLAGSVGIKALDYIVKRTPTPHDDFVVMLIKEALGLVEKARAAKGSKPGGGK